MLSGRRLDLLDPSALDIEVEDIAHGLARVARWNGQTSGAHIFSVAQHSLLVETLAHKRAPGLDRSRRLAVLLHDAPEYVIGDMISPFKAVIGDAYKTVERRLLASDPSPLRPAGEIAAGAGKADQNRRPPSGLPGSHPARRLRHRRSAPVFRPSAARVHLARARLPQAVAGGDGRGALSRAIRQAFCQKRAKPGRRIADF